MVVTRSIDNIYSTFLNRFNTITLFNVQLCYAGQTISNIDYVLIEKLSDGQLVEQVALANLYGWPCV